MNDLHLIEMAPHALSSKELIALLRDEEARHLMSTGWAAAARDELICRLFEMLTANDAAA